MTIIKRLIACGLAALLVASLCACGGKEMPPPETTAPTETDPSTEAPTDAPTESTPPETTEPPTTEPEPSEPETTKGWFPDEAVEPKVVTAYTGTILIHGEPERECTISLPRIEMPGPYIHHINSEIRDTFLTHAADYAYSRYRSYVQGNFLTVIIISYSNMMADSKVEEYQIYTINIETCRPATQEEILEAAGMTREEFREKARAALANAFIIESSHGEYQPDLSSAEEGTEEYLDRAFPFFEEDGSLWAHGVALRLAGQGIRNTVVPLE